MFPKPSITGFATVAPACRRVIPAALDSTSERFCPIFSERFSLENFTRLSADMFLFTIVSVSMFLVVTSCEKSI